MAVKLLPSRSIAWLFITVWLAFWLIFIARGYKKGDYALLKYLYTHNDTDKRRHILGEDLYDFLTFCKTNLPKNATYDYYFELPDRESVAKVYAQYLLYPWKRVTSDYEYKLYYNIDWLKDPGYSLFKSYGKIGRILKKDH